MAEWGRPWAITAGYDIAFLHLILAALEGVPVESRRCTAMPLRSVSVRGLSAQSRRWVAAVNFYLMAAKCEDDLADEGSWKAKLGLKMLGSRLTKAEGVFEDSGFDGEIVSSLPEEQAAVESCADRPLEIYALPTARMLGEVFAHVAVLADRMDLECPLRQLGQGIGCAIYIRDASEDFQTDLEQNSFNALHRSGMKPEAPYVKAVMEREIGRARRGVEKLGLGRDESVALGVLDSLWKVPEKPVTRWRPVRSRLGTCDCGACDCGACDCSACDCSACDCSACDCSSFDCSGCECGSCDCGSCNLSGCNCGDESCCDSDCCCDGCDCCDCSRDGEKAKSTGGTECCLTGGSKSKKQSSDSELDPTVTDLELEAPRWSRLECPACSNALYIHTYFGTDIDECHTCGGIWLDGDKLEVLAKFKELPTRFLEPPSSSPPQLRPKGARPCPHCLQFMTETVVNGVGFDFCEKCPGVWIDHDKIKLASRGE